MIARKNNIDEVKNLARYGFENNFIVLLK